MVACRGDELFGAGELSVDVAAVVHGDRELAATVHDPRSGEFTEFDELDALTGYVDVEPGGDPVGDGDVAVFNGRWGHREQDADVAFPGFGVVGDVDADSKLVAFTAVEFEGLRAECDPVDRRGLGGAGEPGGAVFGDAELGKVRVDNDGPGSPAFDSCLCV